MDRVSSPTYVLLATLLVASIQVHVAEGLSCYCNLWYDYNCVIKSACTGDNMICSVEYLNGGVNRACYQKTYNPNWESRCNGDLNTETYAFACCDNEDNCNEHLEASFRETSTPSPTTPPPPETLSMEGSATATIDSSFGATPTSPSPTPISIVTPSTMTTGNGVGDTTTEAVVATKSSDLSCYCDLQYDWECFRTSSCNGDNIICYKEYLNGKVSHGCYQKTYNPNWESRCNGDLNTETYAIACCDNKDNCNEHLKAPLRGSSTPSPTTSTMLETTSMEGAVIATTDTETVMDADMSTLSASPITDTNASTIMH